MNQEIDQFWKDHEAGHTDEPGYFSDELKDLISNMMRFQPATRISTADIIGHPWVTDPDCATLEEINAEFATRKQAVDEYYREEEEQKRNARAQPAPNADRRDVVWNDKVYVIGDDNPKDQANANKDIVRLQVKDFDP